MEEGMNYSTLVFNKSAAPSKERNEDEVVYSDVKIKEPTTTELKKNEDQVVYSDVKINEPTTTEPKAKEEATVHFEEHADPVTIESKVEAIAESHFRTRLLLLCLGMLCILLAASMIGIIVYITTVMNRQEANLSNLKGRNEQLIVEKRVLENQTEQLMVEKRALENQTEQLMVEKRVLKNQNEELSSDRDYLNWTLGVILTFDSFPVEDFCKDKLCQPCRKGWIQYQKKCYLFYDEEAPWKTWHGSRQYCKDLEADLVVIDNLQEQKFIIKNTESYLDIYHGFWIGLNEIDNGWVWTDGRNDTLGYWMAENIENTGPCVLVMPEKNPAESWNKEKCTFENKFICEHKVLIWSY